MKPGAAIVQLSFWIAIGTAPGCSSPPPAGDGGHDAGNDVHQATDSTGEPREEADSEAHGALGPESGPATHVIDEIQLLDERLCDLDGDGVMDNAVADVGLPASQLMVAAMNTALRGNLEEEGRRFVIHVPWVDDLHTPSDDSVTVILCAAEDVDEPDDGSDDFSGHEPFYCRPSALDECGEPAFFFPELAIEDGHLEGTAERIALPAFDAIVINDGHASGVLGPGGASAEMDVCGYARIRDLGNAGFTTLEGSMLEALLAGGAVLGIPGIPGVLPDVDVDGDGIERVILDPTGRVEYCLDGDNSVVDGTDCWSDPRIADGVSLTLRIGGSPARFAGVEPNWEDHFDTPCDEPPEQSLWDPR